MHPSESVSSGDGIWSNLRDAPLLPVLVSTMYGLSPCWEKGWDAEPDVMEAQFPGTSDAIAHPLCRSLPCPSSKIKFAQSLGGFDPHGFYKPLKKKEENILSRIFLTLTTPQGQFLLTA